MQIRSGGRVSAAFACVFMLAGNAAAADSAPALDALRDIAGRVDAATRETLAVHAEHRSIAAGTATATKRVRAELDAIARAASTQGFANDPSFARKQRQVAQLLANLERAEAAATDATLPALVATTDPERTAHVALAPGRGASCASALTIAPGHAIETNLAAAGAAGSTLWLRIAPAKQGYTRLDTAPTALDTEITLFGAACPASEAEAIQHDDDSRGLAAAVAIDARDGAEVRYARVRNLGRAGRVVARAQTAAAILGRITDQRTGQPLAARVQTVTPDGYYTDSTYASADSGLYLLTTDAGSYYVIVDDPFSPPQSYVTELYPDAPCSNAYYYDLSSCDLADATLLVLADGQQVSGIDVALNVGGRIAGTVRDADGTPIAQASIQAFDSSGGSVSYSFTTDLAGRYTITGLVTGNYYLMASAQGYGSQLWNHIACGGPYGNDCQPLDGTPLAVVRDTLSSGVDFDLPRQAHIHATVSARDGSGVPLSSWSLLVYAADGTFINQFSTYGSMSLDAGPLPPGSYRAFASAADYFAQVWNGIDCPTDCTAELAQGDLITLAAGSEGDISFALLSIPTVSGTITEAGTGTPLANVAVGLVPVGSSYAAVNAYTDAAGHYTLPPYQAGVYYVWASEATHRATVYPDAQCSNNDFTTCNLAGATAVTIAYGGQSAPGTDIAMPLDGSISGRVTMRVPDGMTLPVPAPPYEDVAVRDVNGNYVTSVPITADGTYLLPGIPAGTYYAISTGYGFDQAYDGIDCAFSCAPGVGTPIVIAQGQSVTGIDFDPMPNDYLYGRVTAQDGAPVADVAIDLWRASDGEHCSAAVTNADGYYALHDPSYQCLGTTDRLSTDTDLYENQVYDGIYCPDGSAYLGLCSLDGGTEVSFPSTPEFVIANFVLGPRPETIFASGFDP